MCHRALACPADKAIRFSEAVLEDLADRIALKALQHKFQQSVSKHLIALGYQGVEVYWAPLSEKIETDGPKPSDNASVTERLDYAFFASNRKFRSSPLLDAIARPPPEGDCACLGGSRIFALGYTRGTIVLRAVGVYGAALRRPRRLLRDDRECIVLTARPEMDMRAFLDGLRREAPGHSNEEIEETLSDYCRSVGGGKSAVFVAPSIEELLGANAHSLVSAALGHFTLMCLYMHHHALKSATYFLSPTTEGRTDSSMVVYWPQHPPGHGVLCLLRMLLGLNGYRALALQEELDTLQRGRDHLGHTLGHRIAQVVAYFDGKHSNREKAREYAHYLSSMAGVLHASTLPSLDALLSYPDEKRERFLQSSRAVPNDPDIIDKIRSTWARFADGENTVYVGDCAERVTLQVRLRIRAAIAHAFLRADIKVPGCDELFRPAPALYEPLFDELLLNCSRYGRIRPEDCDTDAKTGIVTVMLSHGVIADVDGARCPAIVLTNLVGRPEKVHKDLRRANAFERWPAGVNRMYEGPGMAIATLERLDLGRCWYHFDEEHCRFHVAVWLKGLTFPGG